MRTGLALLALLFAVPAVAAPRSIEDCEKIQDPHAYNLCLASFGPTRGGGGPAYPGVAAEPAARPAQNGGGARAMRQRPVRMGGYVAGGVTRTKNGRVRMEFLPGRK